MPLFVPILIGAAIVAAGGYGGKKGYDGVSAMRNARKIGEDAERRHRRHVGLLESARDHLSKRLDELHGQRVEIARTTLGRMVELLQALEDAGAVGRIVDGVKTVAEAVKEIALQEVEQERIRANAQVEIERIHAVRDVLLRYLDRSFDERRANFDALFTRLDAAVAQGNLEAVAMTLDAVVKLAQSSPFKDLADVTKAKAALRDKSREWDF